MFDHPVRASSRMASTIAFDGASSPPLAEGSCSLRCEDTCHSKIFEILDYRSDRFSQVTRRHEIEGPRPKRFHEFFKLIEDVVDVQTETEMVNPAVAVTFNHNRLEVRTALK